MTGRHLGILSAILGVPPKPPFGTTRHMKNADESVESRERDPSDLTRRVANYDWEEISARIDESGWGMIPGLLTNAECEVFTNLYSDPRLFRSHIIMARHGFGRGDYKYFGDPLPQSIRSLRTALYERLVTTGNRWNTRLEIDVQFPSSHPEFIERCHQAGQTKPTPLLLRYRSGDFNALHQDVYGDLVFPLQVAVLLSAPMTEFTGGEFVLIEQRPRMQSRAEVVPLSRGDAVAFAVRHRPVEGKRGFYRVNLRHGVSRLRSGKRFTLGVIFHDAR